MLVSDVMSTCVAECTEDARLEEVFELIQQCDHGFVVVVDSVAHRVPIGVVTEHSICEQIIARGRNPKNLLAGSVIDSRIVKLVSTDLVEKIGEANLADVAAVVVVDESRRVCGLIAKEKIRNLAPLAARRAQSSAERISEISALGWIQ